MGSIGWQEIFLLMVFALVVFGPQRLPEIGRQIGKAIREVRKISREFEREVREVTDPFAKEIREAETLARSTYDLDEDLSSFKTPPKEEKPE